MESTTYSELNKKSPEELIDAVIKLEPKPIRDFVPEDSDKIKEDFIANTSGEPTFWYKQLEDVDIEGNINQLQEIRDNLNARSDISEKFKPAYIGYVDRHIDISTLMLLAKEINNNPSPELEEQYQELSQKLYGEVEKDIFVSLLGKLKAKVNELDELGPGALKIRQELMAMLPETENKKVKVAEPSSEVFEYWQEVAASFYGGMLSHVPDKAEGEKFSASEIRDVFATVLSHEFGEAAQDWKVVLDAATVINVKAGEKTIVIPNKYEPITRTHLKGLVAHEVGVHAFRSIMGEGTDLPLLKTGLADYYDSEEGLGKVMEQLVEGQYVDSGENYYIAAGLLLGSVDSPKSFRETYEIMWRQHALLALQNNETPEITDEIIDSAKSLAYKDVFRLKRGTNSRAVFLKDLAYFRGANNMWRYMETIVGDETGFAMMLLGKSDPNISTHRQVILETASV